MTVIGSIKLFFHDKRFTVIILVFWSSLTCTIFYTLGAFSGQFMTFGPSDTTEFMAMKIDTWSKWYALATFSFCNTTINEFIGSALVPWLTNTIQDQKTRYLDHSKSTCMLISLAFDIYTHVMSIFGLYLMFSQFDFLMIRMIADCIVTMFTTWEWMKNKQVDKEKHDLEGGLIVLGPNDRIVNNDADELVCEFRFSKGQDNDDWVESTEMMPPLSSKHHHKRCQSISAMKYDPPTASEESSLLV